MTAVAKRGVAGLAAVAVLVFAGFSGCGLGPGESAGTAELLVTSDYGETTMLAKEIPDVNDSTTVMRALDDSTTIDTRYGGRFVTSINGLKNGTVDGRSSDWFYFVDGVEGDRGGAEYQIKPDDRIWWDYRDWTSAADTRAVVGSYPAPLVGGFNDQDPGVSLDCLGGGGACTSVEAKLKGLGADVVRSADHDRIRVLVGLWSKVRRDEDAQRLEKGPATSGVFARFEPNRSGFDLVGLNPRAEPARNFGPDAGLIAATRPGGRMPVWVITAGSKAGLVTTASALTPELLAHRYAAVVFDRRIASLPLPEGS